MANNNDVQTNESAYEKFMDSQSEDSAVQKFQDRRYVGTKETVGFVLWDAAQSFNINTYSPRFITSIVGVDLGLQTIVNAVNSVWDIFNDIFFGAVIDKTRTRWGKFRPYLLFLAIPGCIFTMLYWLMPNLFAGKSEMDISKFIFYLMLTIIREGEGTFQSIARTGLMSTITPHPNDRTRLITLAIFASGTFGEKLPEQILTILIDVVRGMFINNPAKLNSVYTGLFVGMGLFTTLVSSGASFWFFYNSKERVMQSIKSPSIIMSIKSIINNINNWPFVPKFTLLKLFYYIFIKFICFYINHNNLPPLIITLQTCYILCLLLLLFLLYISFLFFLICLKLFLLD